jgi:hypothetical protein
VKIVEEPFIVPAEQTKWKKDRGHIIVSLPGTKEQRTWSCNTTTWDYLLTHFGTNEADWIGRLVKIHIETHLIGGQNRQVLYGQPHVTRQQTIEPAKVDPTTDTDLLNTLNSLPPDQRKALLEKLDN